jgi:hypothetical protein
MDETNFIDDLFLRIQSLEAENELLERDLKQHKAELDNIETKELVQDQQDELHIIQEIKIRNDQHSSNFSELKNNINFSPEIEKICIFYIPYDNYSQLMICGDFTNWDKKEMTKKDGQFIYEVNLLKGYKYNYIFYYQEEVLIDFTSDYVESDSGMLNNVVSVPKDNLSIKFNKEDYKLLTQAQESFHHVSISDEEEYEIFEKIINFSNFLDEHYQRLKALKEEKMALTRFHYDEKIKKLNELAKFKSSEINSLFAERVFTTSDNSSFLIKEISLENKSIKGIRLYDKNGIKTDYEFYSKHNFYETFPLENIFNHTFINSQLDSEALKKDFMEDNKNILKIYYHLVRDDDNENNQKSLIPYKIFPENVDINSYTMEISDNKITQVRSKETNTIVLFESHVIDMIGLISSSSLKIFTALYNKDIVNIIHIHLNDTSDSIAVDNIFLEKNEKPEDHKSFGLDALERKLNYKFLFRDYKLCKIYYNVSEDFIDELTFEEVRLKPENVVKILRHEIYSNYFAKIRSIPLGMLARKDKNKEEIVERMKSQDMRMEGWCNERYLEELPGFIDLFIFFTPDGTLLETPIKISLPVCTIIPLTPKEEINFEKSLLKAQMKKKNLQSQSLESIYLQFKQLENIMQNDSSANSLSLEESKKTLSEIEKDFSGFKECLDETENLHVIFFLISLEISIY